MATTVSCIVVTTLIVVSLANLVLLVHVILHSVKQCENKSRSSSEKIRHKMHTKREDYSHNNYKTVSPISSTINNNYKFLGALFSTHEDDEIEFICGVAIVSRNWALTAAHCAEVASNRPKDKLKISSNASRIKSGTWHDLDKIISHEKYTSDKHSDDLALISVKQQFKGEYVKSVALAGRHFKYIADTSAISLGWNGEETYAVEAKLIWYKQCNGSYPREKIAENAMFCAEKASCVFDTSEFLVRGDLLIGVVSFEANCTSKLKIYTKIAAFEDWIKSRRVSALFSNSVKKI